MKSMKILVILPLLLGLAGYKIWADESSEALQKRIDTLIKKLGDPEFSVREKATKDLREIGEPALPSLREAAKSDDPEIAWRAKRLVTAIEEGEKKEEEKKQGGEAEEEDFPFHEFFKNPEEAHKYLEKFFKKKIPGVDIHFDFKTVQSLTVVEGGKIYIFNRKNKGGLNITITDTKTDEKKEISVDSLDALKENYPEIYKIYIENGGDSILWGLLEGWKPPEELKKFKDELKKHGHDFEKFMPNEFKKSLKDYKTEIEKFKKEFFKNEEKFKKELKNLKKSLRPLLSDEKEVYGIVVSPADEATKAQLSLDGGVVVCEIKDGILANSGLQKWDIIIKINETSVFTPEELQKSVDAINKPGKGTIELLRRGSRIKLEFQK